MSRPRVEATTDDKAVTPPRIAISAGEPAGIGPDLLVQLAQQPQPAEWVVFADPTLLQDRAARLGLPLTLRSVLWDSQPRPQPAGVLGCLPIGQTPRLHTQSRPGQLASDNAGYVLDCLSAALDACRSQRCAALVTGPAHKGIVNQAGIPFTGHTEWLADRCGVHTVMMLACPGLRVALLTTHLPLRAVPDAVTATLLRRTLRTLHHALRHDFGISAPRIAVAGLNPHAGEDGYLGREEIEIITPVLNELRSEGLKLDGPLPADTLFLPQRMAEFDAALTLYHDQGLPVLKHRGFDQAVNITLGLPIIRTSVDHGTALELAGTGRADPSSFAAAIQTAIDMAGRRMP